MTRLRRAAAAGSGLVLGGLLAGTATYLGLVSGAVPVDLGVGRRTRPLGPISLQIAAPRETVFAVIAAPYAERPSRALREKVQVLARGSDMVLAAHYTSVRGRLRATTVETVLLDAPARVDFRLVRGPVPHVLKSFVLDEADGGTMLVYTGELGTDLWGVGQRWGDLVAGRWESVVLSSLHTVKHEAERRTS